MYTMRPSRLTAVVLITVCLVTASTQAKNFALETNDVADHQISSSVNFLFDLFIRHFTSKLVEEGKTNIQLENFDRSFSTKILSMDIEGAIEVEDGWCGNISSLHRTGDADMSRVNDGLILSTHVGLKDLKIDFNRYDISLLGIHQKGKIYVTVGDNSFFLNLSIQLKPTCIITLTEFKMEKLEDINVDITNLGIFENLTDDITSWVINEVRRIFRKKIEEVVLPELSKAIKKANLCHYLPI